MYTIKSKKNPNSAKICFSTTDIVKAGGRRTPMPRPTVFKDKTTYDRNKMRADLRKTIKEVRHDYR